MKKITLILALALAVFVGGCQKQAEPAAEQKPAVKIGVILPLSGNNAMLGEAWRNAVLLAHEEMGDQAKFKYELIIEDNGFEAKRTSAIMNKLIHADKVNAVLSCGSHVGGVVSPIADKYKVLHIGLASAKSVRQGKLNFVHTTPSEIFVKKFIEMFQEKKISSIASIEMNQEGAKDFIDEMERQIKHTEIQFLGRYKYNMGERDFRTLLLQVTKNPPDLFFISCFSPELEILAKQMKELAINIPVTSNVSFDLAKDLSLLEGRWCASNAKLNESFKKKYQERFNQAQFPYGTGRLYDALKVVIHAYENVSATDKPSSEQVAQFMLNNIQNHPSALGIISIDPEGAFISSIYLCEVQNGQLIKIKEL